MHTLGFDSSREHLPSLSYLKVIVSKVLFPTLQKVDEMQIRVRWKKGPEEIHSWSSESQHINYLYAGDCALVHLKMSCVSRSICSPLTNRADSPGCRPRVPLKNCGDEGAREGETSMWLNILLTSKLEKLLVQLQLSGSPHSLAGNVKAGRCVSQLFCKTRGVQSKQSSDKTRCRLQTGTDSSV